MSMAMDVVTLYRVQQEVFDRVGRESPQAGQGLVNSRLALRLKFTDLPAEITISGRAGRFEAHAGPNGVRPDFDVQLTSEIAHQVLLKQVRLSDAVLQGAIKWTGPFWHLPFLADLFQAAQTVYPVVLQEQGLMPHE
jgi:alkyl sulfatase BDS1-like metallo-beta-lactamase superfamily hydrolase